MKKTLFFVLFMLMGIVSTTLYAVPPAPGVNKQEPKLPSLSRETRDMIFQKMMQSRGRDVNQVRKDIGDRNFAPRGLVILAQFTDVKFKNNNQHDQFNDLFNGDEYNYNGATGSVRRYFRDQSGDQYQPFFDVVGPVTLPHNQKYYGQNKDGGDYYLGDFVIDACDLASQVDGVDFSQYDFNNDGTVDFVYIIYAGFGEADGGSDNTIWPHNFSLMACIAYGLVHPDSPNAQYDYYSGNLPEFDGVWVDNYACSMELRYYSESRTGIGAICHEFSHVLGLPDVYDTQYGTNYYEGYTPGEYDIMDGGSYNNNTNTPPNYSVYEKYYLGWVTPELLRFRMDGQDTIFSYNDTLNAHSDYRMVTRNCYDDPLGPERTDTVFYIENRQDNTDWDRYIPSHGMIVWRVVYDDEAWWGNSPNNTANRPRCTIVAADGDANISSRWYDDDAVPFPGSGNVKSYKPFGQIAQFTGIKESGNQVIYTFTTNKTAVEYPAYYIRSKWGNMRNSWEEMDVINADEYTYTNVINANMVYVGKTQNISDSYKFDITGNNGSRIMGDQLMTGDTVAFTFNPSTATLTARLIGRPEPSALEDTEAEIKADKRLENGRILIRKGDDWFTILGEKL